MQTAAQMSFQASTFLKNYNLYFYFYQSINTSTSVQNACTFAISGDHTTPYELKRGIAKPFLEGLWPAPDFHWTRVSKVPRWRPYWAIRSSRWNAEELWTWTGQSSRLGPRRSLLKQEVRQHWETEQPHRNSNLMLLLLASSCFRFPSSFHEN